ncbi:MAG TPA: aldo/keto reductase, partial [Casimicrobiaceae bacterium]|nr:aldo/keto reductase [Casimicrobiaceae bacterium]
MIRISRRKFVAGMAASVLAPQAFAQTGNASITTRPIPHSGERLPCVGLGTAAVFDRDSDETRKAAGDVVRTLVDAGGRLIDTASTYADAEIVLGKVIASTGLRERIF